MNSDTDWTVLV